MSTRRTAIRRTLGMTVVTTLVAAPAAVAVGEYPVAGVAATVGSTLVEAESGLGGSDLGGGALVEVARHQGPQASSGLVASWSSAATPSSPTV